MMRALLNSWRRKIPLWVGLTLLALLLFFVLFLSLLPLFFSSKYRDSYDKITHKEVEKEACANSRFFKREESLSYYGELDVNLFKAHISDTEFVYKNFDNTTAPPLDGRAVKVPLQWSFGFSLALGYTFFHPDWSFLLKYTYFNQHNSKTLSNLPQQTLVPLQGVLATTSSVLYAKETLSLFLNNLDFTFRKRFHGQENILSTLILGLRTTWIHLKENTIYQGGAQLGNDSDNIYNKMSLGSIGPMMGGEGKWLFTNRFYMRGMAQGALAYAYDRSSYDEERSSISYALYKEHISFVLPSIDFEAGLGYQTWNCKKSVVYNVDLSYQFHYYWQANELIEAKPYTSTRFKLQRSSVSLEGVVLKLAIHF